MNSNSKKLVLVLGVAVTLGAVVSAMGANKSGSTPKPITVLEAGVSYMLQGTTTSQESEAVVLTRLKGVEGVEDAEIMPVPGKSGKRELWVVIRPKIDHDVSASTYYLNGVPVSELKVALI